MKLWRAVIAHFLNGVKKKYAVSPQDVGEHAFRQVPLLYYLNYYAFLRKSDQGLSFS